MKSLFILFSLALVQASSAIPKVNKHTNLHRRPPISTPLAANDVIQEGWVKQRLDNFNPQNTEHFYMRYFMNSGFLEEGGPILIEVGGEWTIYSDWLRGGHLYDMARNLSGILIYTEHRYYGYTTPTPDLELENLRYLNIDQALADLAHFIAYIKEQIPAIRHSQVIITGCSYAGTMVTWFMQKYPHLAVGAWSMSAPLHAQVDFVEYFEVVSKSITKVGGEQCSNRIKTAFEQMEALVAARNANELQRIFQLCEPLDLDKDLDVWSLFGDAAGPWAGYVQYHSEYWGDIQFACDTLLAKQAPSEVEAYGQWLMDRFWISPSECYNHTWAAFLDNFVGRSWDDWSARSGYRQWLYQTCAEYGWYQSSGSENILFGSNFPVNSSLQFCQDLYDGFFTPDRVHGNVERTNTVYGSFNPSVRHVYTSHGELDPWAPMGVSWDINEDSPTVILPMESHCSDMGSISDRDTPEMRAHKENVFKTFVRWLEEDRVKREKRKMKK